VILVDANLLLYAHIADLPRHDAARKWLDGRLNGTAAVGLPWASLLGFVRIASNPRVFERPRTVAQAWRQVESWLDCSPVWVPHPTERHREVVGRLLAASGMRADLVPDAHLAAMAIEHGLTLCSTDGDFARFPGLRWENPLA
jgi:hypothetical protein